MRYRRYRAPASVVEIFNRGMLVPDWLLTIEPTLPTAEYANDMKFAVDVAILETDSHFAVMHRDVRDLGKNLIETTAKGVKIIAPGKPVLVVTSYQPIGK